MSNSTEKDERPPDSEARELHILTQVMALMQELETQARERLLRTIATFFRIDSSRLIDDAHPYPIQPPSVFPTRSFSEDRRQSPKQFLLDKRPRTDVDRIACLAYYLTHFRAQPHFKTVDLSSLNTEAAQVKFGNAAQAVDNAAKVGLLVPATRGLRQLSAPGELYVQLLPDYDRARAAISEQRPRRKSRRSKPDEER